MSTSRRPGARPDTVNYLTRRAPASTPEPLPFNSAMAQHDQLARLGAVLQASQQRLAVVLPALPGAMKRFVGAGGLDDEGWTLLADNAAVAAKLRQLQPHLEQLLREQGLLQGVLRIRVRQT